MNKNLYLTKVSHETTVRVNSQMQLTDKAAPCLIKHHSVKMNGQAEAGRLITPISFNIRNRRASYHACYAAGRMPTPGSKVHDQDFNFIIYGVM